MITATVIAFIFFSLTGVPIAFALGLALTIRWGIAEPYKIPSQSMYPTLNGEEGIGKGDRARAQETNGKSRGRHRAAFYRACGGEKNYSREQDQLSGAKLPLATIRRFYRRSFGKYVEISWL